jgi:ABC-type nitrate/sulfonate/bicarbonate transport system permease component
VPRTLATTLAGLVGVVLVAGLVELVVRLGFISPLVVAPPGALPAAFVSLWREGHVLGPFLVTLAQGFAATILAALVGIPAGYLLWKRPVLGCAYEPWLGAAFAAPTILLYPLFLVITGRGYVTTVVVGCLAATVPVVLKTREGLLAVPPVLIAVGRSLHVPPRQLLARIILPAAAPTVFTGLRLGLIYALVNIIGMEYLIDFGGLGRVVSEMHYRYEIPAMYAAILLIVAVSLLFLRALRGVEVWLRPR